MELGLVNKSLFLVFVLSSSSTDHEGDDDDDDEDESGISITSCCRLGLAFAALSSLLSSLGFGLDCPR